MANEIETPTSRTPAAVEHEIDRTRAELDDTLGEIGRRLSPTELRHEAVAYVKDSASRAVAAARQHPETVALAGIALVGTFILRHNGRVSTRRQQAAQIASIWDRVAAALADHGVHRARDGAGIAELAAKVADMASRAREDVAEVVGDVAARAQESLAKEPIVRLAQPAKRLMHSLEQNTQEHALISLAMAAGAGALLWSVFRR